jgi:hypothetical protein
MEAKTTTGIFRGTKGALKVNNGPNKKSYMWATVDINGVNHPCMIYEKSISCTKSGDKVNCDLRPQPDGVVFITVWNPELLVSTPLPTVADFANLFEMDLEKF